MQHMIAYAMRFVGTPYRWAGSNPISGLDCSGFVQVLLKSAGIDPQGDQSAQALYNHFEHNGSYGVRLPGSLAFFGKSAREITHVGFCVDMFRMIHACGGDHLTLTEADAAAKDAWVKMTLITYRPDLVACIKPYYTKIGLQ